MKQTLIILFVFLSFSAMSQVTDTLQIHNINNKLFLSGIELIKFNKQYNVGLDLEFTGSTIAILGTCVDANENKGLISVGIGIAILGWIININAFDHFKKIGLILKGNSIIIPLHK